MNKKLNKQGTKTTPVEYTDHRVVRLLKKEEVADNTLELSFEKPEGFRFQAGQYAYLSLQNPACSELDEPVRPLSIASHPDEEVLRFVMRKSRSSFKRSCEELRIGDSATIYGPAGTFTLNLSPKGIAFLISGIGISPVIPMLGEIEELQQCASFHSERRANQCRDIKKRVKHSFGIGLLYYGDKQLS